MPYHKNRAVCKMFFFTRGGGAVGQCCSRKCPVVMLSVNNKYNMYFPVYIYIYIYIYVIIQYTSTVCHGCAPSISSTDNSF